MHVLISALSRFSHPSGICRHAANLALCLADSEGVSQVTLVLGKWQKSYFQKAFKINSEKIKIVAIDIKNSSLSRNLWFLLKLPSLVKKINPDLVHFSFPIPFIRQFFSIPVVATIHDFYPYEKPENFGFPNYLFNQLFTNICIRNSDGITCVSQETLAKFKHYFPKLAATRKNTVVYNYVDFSETPPPKVPESIKAEVENTPFLLAVAQHRRNKNLDLVIQGYSWLIDQQNALDSSTKAIVVGSSGPETENLLGLVRNKALEDRVIFISSIDDEELCWLYQNSQVFVCASETEGFCLPLVEALYFSCKIVCSDIPILREVGSDECIYFPLEGNAVKNISDAIAEAIQKSKPRKKEEVFRFSKSNSAREYLDFYGTVI